MAVSSLFLFQLSNNFLVYRLEENISLTFILREVDNNYFLGRPYDRVHIWAGLSSRCSCPLEQGVINSSETSTITRQQNYFDKRRI